MFVVEDYELGKPVNVVVSIYNGENNLGSTKFELGRVLGARGSVVAKELKSRGGAFVVLQAEPVTGTGTLHFQLAGEALKNTEGMGMLNKSDPFFELQRLRRSAKSGARVWDAVFRSSPINNNLNPVWDESYMELSVLGGGNLKEQFRLVVYDFDSNGKHDVMGEVLLSVQDMLQDNCKLELTKKKASTGKIVVVKADVTGMEEHESAPVAEPIEAQTKQAQPSEDIEVAAEEDDIVIEPVEVFTRPTFTDYIAGGLQLHMTIAIDATASNGDPRKPTSLHYFKPDDGQNDYEEALFAICSMLSKYDSDQQFPVFGFGAKRQGSVNHCFELGSTPEVEGVEGILQVYRQAFKSGITMSKPRDFSEVVERTAKSAQEELVGSYSLTVSPFQLSCYSVGSVVPVALDAHRYLYCILNLQSKGQAYSILLIFTNGSPADLDRNLATLKGVNDAPLSVVFIGVGDGDFDGIKSILESHKKGDRDCVQLVRYNELLAAKQSLTEAALDSIPEQLVSYFCIKTIAPLPPVEADEIIVQPYNEGDDVEVPLQMTESGQPVVTGDVNEPTDSGRKFDIKGQAQKLGKRIGKRRLKNMQRRAKRQGMRQMRKFTKQAMGM